MKNQHPWIETADKAFHAAERELGALIIVATRMGEAMHAGNDALDYGREDLLELSKGGPEHAAMLAKAERVLERHRMLVPAVRVIQQLLEGIQQGFSEAPTAPTHPDTK